MGGGLPNTFAARRREAKRSKQSQIDFLRSGAKPNIHGDPSEISGDYGREGREAEAIVWVPDAPVTSADFTFGGGKTSLLQNSTNICTGRPKVKVNLVGHNGKRARYLTPLRAGCKHKKRRHKRHFRAGGR